MRRNAVPSVHDLRGAMESPEIIENEDVGSTANPEEVVQLIVKDHINRVLQDTNKCKEESEEPNQNDLLLQHILELNSEIRTLKKLFPENNSSSKMLNYMDKLLEDLGDEDFLAVMKNPYVGEGITNFITQYKETNV